MPDEHGPPAPELPSSSQSQPWSPQLGRHLLAFCAFPSPPASLSAHSSGSDPKRTVPFIKMFAIKSSAPLLTSTASHGFTSATGRRQYSCSWERGNPTTENMHPKAGELGLSKVRTLNICVGKYNFCLHLSTCALHCPRVSFIAHKNEVVRACSALLSAAAQPRQLQM